jgi:hypothetical protein
MIGLPVQARDCDRRMDMQCEPVNSWLLPRVFGSDGNGSAVTVCSSAGSGSAVTVSVGCIETCVGHRLREWTIASEQRVKKQKARPVSTERASANN